MQISNVPGFRYAAALLYVGAALLLSMIFQPYLPDGFLIFFLCAVMLAGWSGRMAAGLFAAAVSMVAVDYFFVAPYWAFVIHIAELPYLLSFLVSAVVSSWLGSARRWAEEKQKAHLDELFEQTPDAILLVDLQDRVLRVNKKFLEMFDYKVEEVLNRPSIDLIVPTQSKAEVTTIRRRLADGADVNIDTVRQRKDGSLLDVSEVSFRVIAEGKCIAYYVIIRDITENKRSVERLQKAQTELAHLSRITTMGELAASIAHEINQPIGAMVLNGNAALRWLAQRPPNLQGAQEAMDCIVRDGNRAAAVIGRIRTLLAKNSTPMVLLDINEVIREVLAVTTNEIHKRGIAVVTELGSHLPPVVGDRVQLQQVVLNLIMNSLESMTHVTEGALRLEIRSSKNADSVLTQILDCGTGLPVQGADSIFEPFFTTKKDGIGMGLAISRSIIEAHGGRLWAEQRSPQGAVFSFRLPIGANAE